MQENASAVKICRAPSSSVFLCEEPTTERERGRVSASAPWPPVKPIRQTFYASRHRRPGRAAQRQKPKPELATGVGRSWLLPDAQGQGQSVAPSFLASLTAVIDKFGDFCARISSITNGSYLRDNVKFGQ